MTISGSVRSPRRRFAAVVVAAAALACGGESQQTATGRSMAAPAQQASDADNRAPEVRSVRLEPREPSPGTQVEVHVEAVDADGDAVRLRYHWRVGAQVLGQRGPTLMVPREPKGTPIDVTVVASDGRRESEPVRAGARVGNQPPRLVGVRLEPEEGVELGDELIAVADAEDPDHDGVRFRYSWRVNGEPTREQGERFSTSRLRRGDRIRVRVWASDGTMESPPKESTPVQIGNAAPEITSEPTGISQDGVLRYELTARDPDRDRNLRYSLVEGPDGMKIDPILGELTWEPKPDQVGTHVIEVRVADPYGGTASQRFEVTVREVVEEAPPANQAAPGGASGS